MFEMTKGQKERYQHLTVQLPEINISTADVQCRPTVIAVQYKGSSVAEWLEWLACWTQAQKARVQIAVATLS